MTWPADYDCDADELRRAVEDGRRSYDFGLRCWREKEIRAHRMEPLTEQEWRWREEGPVANDKLQTVLEG